MAWGLTCSNDYLECEFQMKLGSLPLSFSHIQINVLICYDCPGKSLRTSLGHLVLAFQFQLSVMIQGFLMKYGKVSVHLLLGILS